MYQVIYMDVKAAGARGRVASRTATSPEKCMT